MTSANGTDLLSEETPPQRLVRGAGLRPDAAQALRRSPSLQGRVRTGEHSGIRREALHKTRQGTGWKRRPVLRVRILSGADPVTLWLSPASRKDRVCAMRQPPLASLLAAIPSTPGASPPALLRHPDSHKPCGSPVRAFPCAPAALPPPASAPRSCGYPEFSLDFILSDLILQWRFVEDPSMLRLCLLLSLPLFSLGCAPSCPEPVSQQRGTRVFPPTKMKARPAEILFENPEDEKE